MDIVIYYRDLISKFAHISRPLYKVSWLSIVEWIPKLFLSFDELKQKLHEPRIVKMADHQQKFIIEINESRFVIDAVFKQYFDGTGR